MRLLWYSLVSYLREREFSMHALLQTRWLLLLLTLLSTQAFAVSKPAVVYSAADKFDKSVNQEVYEQGVVRFFKETGIQVTERSPASEAERLSTLRELAAAGYTPIVVVGNEQLTALQGVVDQFPKAQFTLLDGQLDKPNVRSILFKEQGEVLLLRFANDLEDYAKVDQMPVLEGKRMTIQLSPKKGAAPKKPATPKPAEAPKAAPAEDKSED